MYISLKHNTLISFATALLLSTTALANSTQQATGAAEHKARNAAAGETLQEAPIQTGLAGSFLSSRFARHHEDLAQAAKFLNESVARDPQNEELALEALRTNLLAGDMPQSLALATQLAPLSKTDSLIASLLMLKAVEEGDYVKAQQVISTSTESGLFGIVRPVILQWLALGAGSAKAPVDMQAAIEKSGFFAPFITYHVALMNDVLGSEVAARAAYSKTSADPTVTPYRVVEAVANFYARRGEWEKAQAAFDAYAKANPDSSLIPPALNANKAAPTPMIANAKDGLAELFFTTASILFGEDATQDTFLYLRVALELKPDLPPAQLMLANLYEQVEDYEAAIATYDSIAPGSVFYRRGQIRKALNFEALGKKREAIALLDKTAAANPNDTIAVITKGDMLREQEKFADAAAAYSDAIRRADPLKSSDWPLLYARGISYERAEQWDKAEADFTRALELEPGQPDVLNYLAYSWLTMDKNVDKAREYLEIAVQARPEEPHILDSAGYGEYLSGNYEKAVEYLEKAVELMPDDPTINDHLGDAYWRVGRKAEAQFSWQRALNNKPDEALEKTLKDKLANGLPEPGDQRSQLGAAAMPVATQVR